MPVKFNGRYLDGFVRGAEFEKLWPTAQLAMQQLADHTGPGSDFLGWMDLPVNYDKTEFAAIKAAAARIRQDTDVLVVIGIGGSYLGARAVIEAVCGANYNSLCTDTPKIFFAGNSISPDALQDVLAACEGKRVSVNVISKSGTTTEPAVAFRVMRGYLESRYGVEEARRRIYATTDAARGTLKALADAEGYTSFVVPDDVGGRYSVLTAVGLLPIACAGIDIDALMAGAAAARAAYSDTAAPDDCSRYAMARNLLYRRGKTVETLVCYEPAFAMMNEWFKQLYGESEGKDGKGLMPTSVIYSTDLHSMGQYLQDGARLMFETVVDVRHPKNDLPVPSGDDADGLGFLCGRNLSDINRQAMLGTVLAHTDGGVPNILLEVDSLGAYDMGWLIYFFERACAISGYMLGVNPFDQPGVESYKQNMFALLGKPGYEDRAAVLAARLAD